MTACMNYRGENFVVCYILRVGEIHSFVPPTVHMMCLTATASLELRKQVENIVGLKNPKFSLCCHAKLTSYTLLSHMKII